MDPIDPPDNGRKMKAPYEVEELVVYARLSDLRPHHFARLSKLRRLVIAPQLEEIHRSDPTRGPAEFPEPVILRAGLFRHLTELRELRIFMKEIISIEPGAFEGLGRVTSLDLSENRLEDFSPGTFAGLNRLQHLKLQRNRLGALKRQYFADLPELWRLELDGNAIRTMEPDTFYRQSKLISLSLAHNALRLIDRRALFGMTSLCALDLSGNPLAASALSSLDAVGPRAMISVSRRHRVVSAEAREIRRAYAVAS